MCGRSDDSDPTEGEEIEIRASVLFDFIAFHRVRQRIMTDMKQGPIDYDKIREIQGSLGISSKKETLYGLLPRRILQRLRAFGNKMRIFPISNQEISF